MHSLIARSIEAISFGVSRCTVGSSMVPRRSEISWALPSMFRRSWLILLTARPSEASRVFWCSVCASSACMRDNSSSATPSSSDRCDGLMMRL